MDDEIRQLRFLVRKSAELLDKELGSFLQQHNYAGTIIGITFIFVPFFISGLSDALPVIRVIAIVPIVLFFWGLLLLLSIFRAKSTGQAFIWDEYDNLLKSSYRETLLYFIKANTQTHERNKKIIFESHKKYDTGIKLTIVAMLISIVLLLISTFNKMPKTPFKAPTGETSELISNPNHNFISFIT